MALYEYRCDECKARFELIRSASDPSEVKCVKCQSIRVSKLISRFAVGGQGDLRESTFYHGCHRSDVGSGHHSHGHSHDFGGGGDGGHVHGPGCGHGGGGGSDAGSGPGSDSGSGSGSDGGGSAGTP